MVDPAGSAAPERNGAATGALGDATDTILSIELAPLADDGRQVVRVGGEIDMLTAPRLRDTLSPVVSVAGVDVVLDLDAVTFLGSNVLGVLVELSQQAETVGAKFRLVCANRTVSRPLTLTGLDQVLDFYESAADLPPFGS